MNVWKRKAIVINIASRKKFTRQEKPKTNLISFPVMERKAKTCEDCGRPFFEEVCPDCGPLGERKEG